MANRYLSLLKDTAIYGMSGSFGVAIGFLLIPLYTRIFNPGQYGIVDIITVTIALINLFLTLGLDSAMAVFYYDSKDIRIRKTTVSTSFYFEFVLTLIISQILLLFSDSFSIFFFRSTEYATLFGISFLTIPFYHSNRIFKLVLRIKQQPISNSFLTIGNVLISSLLIIFFVLVQKIGIQGIFLGQFFGSLLFCVVGFLFTFNELSFHFSFKKLYQLLAYGIPLIPASIALWIMGSSNRFFLNEFVDLTEVGLFAIATKISNLLLLVLSSFQLAYGPFAFSLKNKTEATNVYAKVLTYFVLVSSFFAVSFSIFAKELLLLFTTYEYLEASKIVAILCFVVVFNSLYIMISLGIQLVKKSKYISLAFVFSSALNIFLNFLLIPPFGMIGAAIALLITNCTTFYILYQMAQKCYFIPYEVKKIMIIFFFSGVIVIMDVLIQFDNTGLNILLKILLIIAFITLLIIFKTIERYEIELLFRSAMNTIQRIKSSLPLLGDK